MADLKKIQSEIARGFNLLRKIYVNGEGVEQMAMAKGSLANAHKLVSAAIEEEKTVEKEEHHGE